MKVILKDNSIYSVGSWDSGKDRWVWLRLHYGGRKQLHSKSKRDKVCQSKHYTAHQWHNRSL